MIVKEAYVWYMKGRHIVFSSNIHAVAKSALSWLNLPYERDLAEASLKISMIWAAPRTFTKLN